MTFLSAVAEKIRQGHPALRVEVTSISNNVCRSSAVLGASPPGPIAGDAVYADISFFDRDGVIRAVGGLHGASGTIDAYFEAALHPISESATREWVARAQHEIMRKIEEQLPDISRIVEEEAAFEKEHSEPDSATLADEG